MKLSRPLPLIRLILTKLKQADFTERGLGQYFFLLAFSWRPCCYAKETAEQNSKFQETSFTLYLLFISILLYYKSHFRQTRHLYSRASLRVARTCILLEVFLIKFYPIKVRCLKFTSWKVVADQITYLPQSHLKYPHEC